MKRKLMIILLLIMIFTVFGCKKKTISFDSSKSHLFIGLYEGGFGRDWLEAIAANFEELVKDVSFEEGKVGLEIHIDGKKTEYQNDNLSVSITTNDQDMYFSSINLKNFISKDLLMDVTDLVTTPLTEYGETKSIADKMHAMAKETTLGSSTTGDKYYAVPFYAAFDNIVYDVDLFEEKKLYFDDNGGWTSGLPGSNAKSAGQDGIKGTYDDGLPSTWEEYKTMLNRMVVLSITPFIWNGTYSWYRTDMLTSLWANYEGANNFALNISFDGTDSKLGKIDYTNGYLLQQQVGKLKALEFASYIIKNENFYASSGFSSSDHMGAQDEYLYSKAKAQSGAGKRIAMIFEGNWWEHEAIETIKEMAETNADESYKNRRFGLMPFPKMDENAADGYVMYSVSYNSNIFIRKNANLPEACKQFFRYVNTDENLRLYTRISGSIRDYDYELTEEDKQSMTYFQNAVWDRYSNPTTTIVYDSNSTRISLSFPELVRGSWAWGATFDGHILDDPFYAFKYYGTKKENNKTVDYLTPEAYFEALQTTYDKNYWDTTIAGRL